MDVQTRMKYRASLSPPAAQAPTSPLSQEEISCLTLIWRALKLFLAPGLGTAGGRPSEQMRRVKQTLLTVLCSDAEIDAAIMVKMFGGRTGRWKQSLSDARCRAEFNREADQSSMRFWDPTKRRSNAFAEELCSQARSFWCSDEVSRQLPANLSTDSGKHPGPRFAQCVPTEKAHVMFIESRQHGCDGDVDFRCSLEWFRRQRPPNVTRNKRSYALCVYHLRDFHIMDALFRLLRKLHTSSKSLGITTAARCSCKCVEGLSLSQFREAMMCPREKVRLHAGVPECLFGKDSCRAGNCPSCPGLPQCPLLVSVLDGDVELRIRYMQLTQEYDAQSGALTRKRDTFATAVVPFSDFVQRELKGYSWGHDFSQHRFVSRWQNRAFDAMQTLLAVNTIVAVIDFAMNWAGEGNMDPSQSFFNPLSATLVPVVLTIRRENLTDAKFKTEFGDQFLQKNDDYMARQTHLPDGRVRVTLVFVSEDKTHDTEFVKHVTMRVTRWIETYTHGVSTIEWWSDGCRVRINSRCLPIPSEFLRRSWCQHFSVLKSDPLFPILDLVLRNRHSLNVAITWAT